MKILKVRFKNLNSLAGEWSIDFSHPAFISDGIFSISGPTGAGKTTILDAICIALYGRTPRLRQLSKTVNEIMTRRTGECYAEVTFQTNQGIFRTHWSQKRARKSPEGDLQPPRHEIADASNGTILESKMRSVAQRIESITGMDFERFTRSMLLAQGEFSAFLKATQKERGPILEQISGTEIYGRISVKVHRLCSEEHRILDMLKTELSGYKSMTESEIAETNLRINEIEAQERQLRKLRDGLQESLSRLARIEALEEESAALAKHAAEIENKRNDFEPQSRKIASAVKASKIEPAYACTVPVRKQAEQARQEIKEAETRIPILAKSATNAENLENSALSAFEKAKAENDFILPLLRRVREIDAAAAEKKVQADAIKTGLNNIRNEIKQIFESEQACGSALDNFKAKLSAIGNDLLVSAADEELVTNFSAVSISVGQIIENVGKKEKILLEVTNSENTLRAAETSRGTLQTSLEVINAKKIESERIVSEIREKMLFLLKGREAQEWRNELDAFRIRKTSLKKALDLLERIEDNSNMLNKQSSLLNETEKEKHRLKANIATLTESRDKCAVKFRELEERTAFLDKTRDLATERCNLSEGNPCPLCGALEHPYATGGIPASDDVHQALKIARDELEQVVEGLAGLNVRLAVNEQNCSRIRERITEIVSGQESLKSALDGLLSEQAADIALLESTAAIADNLAITERRIQDISTLLAALDKLEKDCRQGEENFEASLKTCNESEKALQKATHQCDIALRDMKHLELELSNLEKSLAEQFNELRSEMGKYGIDPAIDALETALAILAQRKEAWISKKREKDELEKQISTTSGEITRFKTLSERLSAEAIARESNLEILRTQIATLESERNDIFKGDSADKEEKRLATALAASTEAVDNAKKQAIAERRELEILQSGIMHLKDSQKKIETELVETEKLFTDKLNDAGFGSEDEFLSSRLSECRLKELQDEEERLKNDYRETETLRKIKAETLRLEKAALGSEQKGENLKTDLDSCETNLKKLQMELGALRQRLSDDNASGLQRRAILERIESQTRKCHSWDSLHELIGSADGDKFRVFAQGLTFETMIGHANRHLRAMSDRYLLIRDETRPLELNIVDAYQASEVRSTANLSGGESFIVSLALALGLAQMASKNVRVDSLFLDEGFGTLDEETLETAIETLAGLQRSGKLIGVISHFSALKDRIAAQIQVIPKSSGRSIITGPGCSRANL